MILEYEIGKKDVVDFNMYHLYHNKRIGPSMYILTFILAVWIFRALLWVFPDLLETYYDLWGWLKALSVTGILSAGYLLSRTMMKLLCIAGVERERKKNRNHPLGMRRIELNEDGMKVNFRSFESVYKWEGLYKIVERKKYYYIYMTSESAQIIPKRILAEKGEEAEFISLIRNRGTKKRNERMKAEYDIVVWPLSVYYI